MAAGGYHTCALLESGGVKCWGSNLAGQLGDGSQTDRLTPVDAAGLSGEVSAIAAGAFHTCAVLESGEVEYWGENTFGRLGGGTWLDRTLLVSVEGLWAKARRVAAGSAHTCALRRGARHQMLGRQQLRPVGRWHLQSDHPARECGRLIWGCAGDDGWACTQLCIAWRGGMVFWGMIRTANWGMVLPACTPSPWGCWVSRETRVSGRQ